MKETAEDILDLFDLYLDGWSTGMHFTVYIKQVQTLVNAMRTDMKKVIDPYKKEYAEKRKARTIKQF